MTTEDWSFCQQALIRHSRTFAIPISLLTPTLERAITTAYLLCRIADSVEDTAVWSVRDKDLLYRDLLDAVDLNAAPEHFVQRVIGLAGGDKDELELLRGLPRVLAVLAECPPGIQQLTRNWVSELTRGMAVYSRRQPGSDGIYCLLSEADLERYCYFVAGAIGHLLTDVFLHELVTSPEQERCLRANSERFGTGLQLVNILRDICGDLSRDVCFIPRTLLAAHGLTPARLTDREYAPLARKALEPLFVQARAHLDAAFEYILAIPNTSPEIRNFCLVPLWLAVPTLELCRTDPRLFMPTQHVKLERAQVVALIQQCTGAAKDDVALRNHYRQLTARGESRTEPSGSAVGAGVNREP